MRTDKQKVSKPSSNVVHKNKNNNLKGTNAE